VKDKTSIALVPNTGSVRLAVTTESRIATDRHRAIAYTAVA